VNDYKWSYTYDGNNNQTEQLFQAWDGYDWLNQYRFSYTYNGNNNQTEQLFQTWDGSAWVNDSKWSYTYDGNNNLTEGSTKPGMVLPGYIIINIYIHIYQQELSNLR